MDYIAMGKRIRRQRRWMDISQEQLAELVGVSTSFIGHIERGTRVPSLDTIWRMCKALEVSMDHITGL